MRKPSADKRSNHDMCVGSVLTREYDIGEHYAREISATLEQRSDLRWCQSDQINVPALFGSLKRAVVLALADAMFGKRRPDGWWRRVDAVAMVIAERRIDELLDADAVSATLEVRQQQAKAIKGLLHVSGGVRLIEQLPPALMLTGAPTLERMAQRGEILALPWIGFRDVLFPLAQFDAEGHPAPGLKQVRDRLIDLPLHARLVFLLAPLSNDEGRSPLQLLHTREIRRVLKAADRLVFEASTSSHSSQPSRL